MRAWIAAMLRAPSQAGEDRLQPLAVHMRVAIDQAGHDGAAAERDHAGFRPLVAGHHRGIAHGEELAVAHRRRLGDAEAGIAGDDAAAGQDGVCSLHQSPLASTPARSMPAQRSTSARK